MDELKTPGIKEKKITLSKEELNALISTAVKAEVEKSTHSQPISQARRVREHTLKLREVEGKYVVAIKKDMYNRVKFDNAKNDRGNPDMIVTVSLVDEAGKLEEKKMFYLLDLLNGTMETWVPIVKTRREEIISSHGTTTRKKVEDYRTIDTGERVALETVTEVLYHTVRLPGGLEYEIDAEFTNM